MYMEGVSVVCGGWSSNVGTDCGPPFYLLHDY